MRNYPILGLIGYLNHKGCRWTDKEKEILLEKGVPKSFLKILDQFAASRRNPSSAGSVPCMGLKGACAQRAEFQLSCPHRATYRACSRCFLLNVEKAKCGCAVENVKSIPTDPFKIEPVPIDDQEDLLDYEFRWIRNEFFENIGLFQDRFGNKYEHAGSWKDGRPGNGPHSQRPGSGPHSQLGHPDLGGRRGGVVGRAVVGALPPQQSRPKTARKVMSRL